eukprot:4563707-Prymnesium_polylepis.1
MFAVRDCLRPRARVVVRVAGAGRAFVFCVDLGRDDHLFATVALRHGPGRRQHGRRDVHAALRRWAAHSNTLRVRRRARRSFAAAPAMSAVDPIRQQRTSAAPAAPPPMAAPPPPPPAPPLLPPA